MNEQLKEHEFLIKLRQSLVLDEESSFKKGQVRQSRNSMLSQNSLRMPQSHVQEQENEIFGNYYVGSRFNIALIEECINKFQLKYQKASDDEKKDGIKVYFEQKGNEEVFWQQESIIFPFKPKKKILAFEDSCVSLSK